MLKAARLTLDPSVLHTSWGNLGDWTATSSYPEACVALARRLGEAARLTPSDRVLDVGCGRGDQLLEWREWFGVREVEGLDLLEAHVASARARGLEVSQGDAADLGRYPSDSCDVVLALDAAYHFHPRSQFFEEARRVLRPGGRLALTDLLLADRELGRVRRGLLRFLARSAAIPAGNVVGWPAYRQTLEGAGFTAVSSRSLGAEVLDGFAAFARRVNLSPTLTCAKIVATGRACAFARSRGLLDYTLVTAEASA